MSKPAKIVVVDAYTMNPGDLSWAPLEALGPLTVYHRSGPLLAERIAEAEVVLTNKEPLDASLLEGLPHLKLISILATGTNVVDLQAARRRGVTVCNVPAYSTNSVAQHTLSLLLELNNQVGAHHAAVVKGQWANNPDFSFTLAPIQELAGMTMGIIGWGSIGRSVAEVARALGMKVRVADSLRDPATPYAEADIARTPLEELLRHADVLSLHCPLTTRTEKLVDMSFLARMKPGALLLNTGRGALIDENAVAQALRDGTLGGFGADVLCEEPPRAEHPLVGAPRCVLTPHNAWASVQARRRLMEVTVQNVHAFLDGTPQNVVN